MPVVGVEPTRVISTRDFEFLSSSSIWCHPVISSGIWFPLHKGKIHASMNNNLKYPRFFVAFSLYSVFSIWTAQMENPPQNSKSLVLITRVGSTPTTGIKRKPSSLSGGLSFYLRRVSGSNSTTLHSRGAISPAGCCSVRGRPPPPA